MINTGSVSISYHIYHAFFIYFKGGFWHLTTCRLIYYNGTLYAGGDASITIVSPDSCGVVWYAQDIHLFIGDDYVSE